MIDLSKLEQYKENNRIEAKKALGGLPHSIWETYSAFANTIGGVILLGVEEYRDKSFHTVNLPDPERLKNEFWNAVNDPIIANINILSANDVRIEVINGDHILVIEVPRADRLDKPVYIAGNPLNTYRRNGEGDYRCTPEEYQAMVRDAAVESQDMLILEGMDTGIFNPESVRRYRELMMITRPAHIWEDLEDEEFLLKMGAVRIGQDGEKHPTCGGLLLFGNEYDIIRVFPHYLLDYRGECDDHTGRTDRIISDSGDWSGNILDFYFRISDKLLPDLKIPFIIPNGIRINDNSVCMALREALANCIVNADYYGRGGIVVARGKQTISFSNPGSFRINISTAKKGGLSDPRNTVIQKTLGMINICEHAGNGIANMFRIWKSQNWPEPEFIQTTEPDRITLTLTLKPVETGKPLKKNDGKNEPGIRMVKRQMIINYLTEHIEASSADLSVYLDLKPSRVRYYLRGLIRDEIVVPDGNNRNRKYKLKS